MTTTRRFTADDLFKFNNVNLDFYTETYNIPFYFEYLATWPEYFYTIETPHEGTVMGYGRFSENRIHHDFKLQ